MGQHPVQPGRADGRIFLGDLHLGNVLSSALEFSSAVLQRVQGALYVKFEAFHGNILYATLRRFPPPAWCEGTCSSWQDRRHNLGQTVPEPSSQRLNRSSLESVLRS